MSDTQVTIGFGGSTADFEAACRRAQQALGGLSGQVATTTTNLAASTAALNANSAATNAVAQATQAWSAVMGTTSAATSRATQDLRALIDATTGVSRESRSAAEAADVFRQALGDQTNEVKALKAANEEAAHAANGLGASSHGVTRELIVLGHEMMMGNTSRFAGSLLVMGELLSNVSAYACIAAASVFGLGMAVYHFAEYLHHAAEEARALNNQMVLMGRDPEATTIAAKALTDRLRTTGDIGSSAARGIAAEFMRIPNTVEDTRVKLAELVPALHAATDGEPIEKFAASFAKASSSVNGIKRIFEENDLFGNAQQREAIEGFARTNDLAGAQGLLIERLKDRYVDQYNAVSAANREARQSAQIMNDAPMLAAILNPGTQQKLKLTEPARSPQDAQLDEQQAKLNAHKVEEIELDKTIDALRARLAQTVDAAARKDVENALHVAEANRASMRERGDTSWLQRQEEALAEQNNLIVQSAKTSKAATEGKLANEVQYWGKVLAGDQLTDEQKFQAKKRLTQAEMQLNEARLRDKEAADRAGVRSAHKSTQEQIAELSAMQAANKDDFTKWSELEQQKLEVLRTAYGVMSAEYQRELKAEETYQREHSLKMLAEQLKAIDEQNKLGDKQLQGTIQRLNAEAVAGLRGKADELQATRTATEQESQIELGRLDTFIATLTKGTAEYKKAMDQRELLYQTFQNKIGTIDLRIAEQQQRDAARSAQTYARAFDGIASSGERMVSSLATGSTTVAKAEQQMASSVLQSVVQLATSVVSKWAAMELAKTTTTRAGDAARAAVEKGDGLGGAIAAMISQWLGMETSKTAATVAGSEARVLAQTVAAKEGAVAERAANSASIAGDAAKAAAGAYAAVAEIPVIGPVLAPAAAGVAYAAVTAFGGQLPSFDVGAWNLPSNMIAQVHAGEMIVPAFQADAMRNGASLGGGPTINIHASAMDGPGMMGALKSVMPQLAKAMQQHLSLNPSLRSS